MGEEEEHAINPRSCSTALSLQTIIILIQAVAGEELNRVQIEEETVFPPPMEWGTWALFNVISGAFKYPVSDGGSWCVHEEKVKKRAAPVRGFIIKDMKDSQES